MTEQKYDKPLTTMPFGKKYKGWPLNAIPETGYLEWAVGVIERDSIRRAVEAELERRRKGGMLAPYDPSVTTSGSAPATKLAPLDEPVYRLCERMIEHGHTHLAEITRKGIEDGDADESLANMVDRGQAELLKMLSERGIKPGSAPPRVGPPVEPDDFEPF